jgi:ABC-type amino acid transport substrate-binding protein
MMVAAALRAAVLSRSLADKGKALREHCVRTIVTAAVMLLAATLPGRAQGAPPDVLKDLAPTGKLRAAINFGNGVLAQKGKDGEPQGITADLSRELAKRLGVEVVFVTFEAAGKVFDAAKAGSWDIGFVAIEPVRAAPIDFTAPYVIIDGTYMVRKDSPLKEVDDVDKPGIKIAVGLGSAYDLYLTRTIKNATLVARQGRRRQGDDRALAQRQARCGSRRASAARSLRQGSCRCANHEWGVSGDQAGDGHTEGPH